MDGHFEKIWKNETAGLQSLITDIEDNINQRLATVERNIKNAFATVLRRNKDKHEIPAKMAEMDYFKQLRKEYLVEKNSCKKAPEYFQEPSFWKRTINLEKAVTGAKNAASKIIPFVDGDKPKIEKILMKQLLDAIQEIVEKGVTPKQDYDQKNIQNVVDNFFTTTENIIKTNKVNINNNINMFNKS